MGTEYDWMTFLFATQRLLGFNDLMSIYRHACHPAHAGNSAGLDDVLCNQPNPSTGNQSVPIAWTDGDIGGTPHGGFLSGAERKWGLNRPPSNSVDTFGDEHGVSDDVSP